MDEGADPMFQMMGELMGEEVRSDLDLPTTVTTGRPPVYAVVRNMSPDKIVAKLQKLADPYLKENALDFMETRSSFGDRFGKSKREIDKSPRFKYYEDEGRLFFPAARDGE